MSKGNADTVHSIPFKDKTTEIGCWLRTLDKNNSSEEIYYLKKSHILSPKDEFIDLSKDEYEQSDDLYKRTMEK